MKPLIRVLAELAVILICMVTHGIALFPGSRAHASCAGRFVATMTDILSGAESQARSPEVEQNPRELLTRALRHASEFEEPLERYLLFAEIVKAQCGTGDDRGALATINLLPSEKNSYRWLGLSEIVEAQASQGRVKEAMETYKHIEPDAVRHLAARRIAASQEKVGDRKGAAQTVQSISSPERKLEALLELAAIRASAGDRLLAGETIGEATALLRTVPELSESAERWSDLGLAWSSLGERRAAQDLFRSARQLADKKVDKTARAYDYHFIIRGRANAGDIAGAWEMSRELGDETDVFQTRIKDKAVRAIALALSRSGHFVEAEQAITQIQGQSERAHALADLAEAEGLNGQGARAKERLKVALDLVEKNSEAASVLALAAIANARIALKDLDAARTVAGRLGSGTRDELLKNIPAAECRSGDLQAAEKTFQSIENSVYKAECAQIVSAERTRKRVPKTVTWAEQLATPSLRVHALIGIALGLKSVSAMP